MSIPVPKAELLGTLLELVFYGMYIIVFYECLHVFYMRHKAGRDMRCLLATALVIFGLITAHLVIDTVRVVDGFTQHMDVANAPVAYYKSITPRARLSKVGLYIALTLIADALFVYRVFVVWGRNRWAAALPVTLYIADIGFSAWSIWSLVVVDPHASPVVANTVIRVKYFYIMTLVLNFLCTAMISWKIWSIHRHVAEPAVAGVRFMGVLAVILESAAIYSFLLIALIVTTSVSTNGMWVVLNVICPIIGMVFSAIMVRASREYHTDTFMSTSVSLGASAGAERPLSLQSLAARAHDKLPLPLPPRLAHAGDAADARSVRSRASGEDLEKGSTTVRGEC